MIKKIKDWIFWKYFSDYSVFSFEVSIEKFEVHGKFYDNYFEIIVDPKNFRRTFRRFGPVTITGDAYSNRFVL